MRIRVLLLLLLLFLPRQALAELEEIKPRLLPLQGAVQEQGAEISGLAWHGDKLILLPQMPDFATNNRASKAAFFAVERQDLLSRLNNESNEPLSCEEIALHGLEAVQALPGYEGFEAIAVRDDTAWLLMEANDHGTMRSWLVRGHFRDSALHLDPDGLAPLPLPANLRNMSHETLVLGEDFLLVLYEANGAAVNPRPVALRLPLSENPAAHIEEISFPNVEYRITDATAVIRRDARQFFWAANFFWPGERKLLKPGADAVDARWGQGPTHRRSDAVERLLLFEITAKGIVLADAPPLPLALGMLPRNWEGVALLEGAKQRGLLLATDKYPGTLLGFVPLPPDDGLPRK